MSYRAYCLDHNWEGAKQPNKSESQKDLSAHKASFPNEIHDASGIREINDQKSK